MLQRMKSFFAQLNFFQSIPPSTDPVTIQQQRLSTRLFLLLLASSITVIFIYLNITRIINTDTIEEPIYSQYLELFKKQSDTLVCQCSQISVTYQDFLTINYQQHQICTSDFTTDEWIDYLKLNRNIQIDYFLEHFRSFGSSTFQALQSFCQLANRTITNKLIQFYADQFVSTTITLHDTMQRQIKTLIDGFVLSTTNDLQLSLALVRKLIHVNGYWGVRLPNYVLYFLPGSTSFAFLPYDISNCSCLVSSSCKTDLGFYDTTATLIDTIPGLYLGCLLTEALLQSDLRCFYNQTCLSQLQFHINKTTSHTFHPLDSTLPTRFTPTSSVQELMNALMVETWNLSFSHEDYYHQCRPSVCTYTYSDRYDIVYIVTTIFSLVGGLITVLKVLIPPLVTYGQQQLQRCKHRETNAPADRMSLTQFITQSLNFAKTLNLFASVPPSTDEAEIRRQRISTRLYLTMLCLGIFILFTYMELIPVSKTDTVAWPSIEKYEKLYSKYSQTLSCPCSQISTRYDEFLQVEYVMHDVCRSVFITSAWVEYLIASTAEMRLLGKDFRWTQKLMSQGLQILCELTNETVDDMRNTLYSNQYVTSTLTSKTIFELQILEFFNHFVSITTNSFLSQIKNIRSLFQANGIMSVFGTHYIIGRTLTENYLSIGAALYENCDCMSSATCIAPSQIFDALHNPVYTIHDMYIGCTTIEALLQSSLTCYYEQTCITTFLSYLAYNPPMKVSPLDPSTLRIHHINSTVKELVDDLMVERWKTSTSYENYYNSCRPTQCSYTFNSQNDALYVVTTLFGLIGGLATVLGLVIPHLMKLIDLSIRWLKQITGHHPRQDDLDNHIGYIQTIRRWVRFGSNWLINFNYFASIPPSTDPIELRKQKIATRLFEVLLIVSTITLLIYNSAVKTEKMFIIVSPSFEQYSFYFDTYSNTLTCHCSQINIGYDQFLNVSYSRHPLCQSTFITSAFRGTFFPTVGDEQMFWSNYESHGSLYFQGLETICDMTNRTIIDNLERFYLNKYITAMVSTSDLFHSQTQVMFDTFISSMTSNILNSLETIHDVTHSNALFSGTWTNYNLQLESIDGLPGGYWLQADPLQYDGCDCSISPKCIARASLADRSNLDVDFLIPGFFVGCHVTEALVQSTLECLFNATCLSIIRSYLLINETFITPSLNESALRRTSFNSTVQELLNNILIEEWKFEKSFPDYYNQCAPSKCTYMVSIRNDPIFVITAMFGLAGGLVNILRFILPIIVEAIFNVIVQYQQRQIRKVAIVQAWAN